MYVFTFHLLKNKIILSDKFTYPARVMFLQIIVSLCFHIAFKFSRLLGIKEICRLYLN
jgi:hypothetical protein